MLGLHLTADLHGCSATAALYTEPEAIARCCIEAALAAGLIVVGERWHAFAPASAGGPGGVTGVLLLAESHMALHTWPELRQVTLDVFVCNLQGDNSAKAEALMAALLRAYPAEEVRLQRLQRG